MSHWVLAIDFGSSYTTAASRSDGPASIIEIDGDRRVPSVIFAPGDGTFRVGKAAAGHDVTHPDRVLREPKRLLGEPAPVVLGGVAYPIEALVGALLGHVYRSAVEYEGSRPAEVRLTHPATWRRARVSALQRAATAGGIDSVVLIPEPIAAALAYTPESPDARSTHVAIYDLGGGTFDTAILRRVGTSFEVVGRPSGDSRLGGQFFDELLSRHLGEQLQADTWHSLQSSQEVVWRQAMAAFLASVRVAKEALSLQTETHVLVALPNGLVELKVTRTELESLVRPHLEDTVEILRATLDDANISSDQLDGIYLVGGASRMPLVEEILAAAFP